MQEANISDVDPAVKTSLSFYEESNWSNRPSIERGKILLKVAEEFFIRRLELSALIVKEAGKTMNEALADEIVDAYNNTGGVVKKKEEVHRMAQANRAFAHLRW